MSQYFHIIRRAFSTVTNQREHITRLVYTFKRNTLDPAFRAKTSYYNDTVHLLSKAKQFELIEEILDDQKKYIDATNEDFTVRLISLYGKSGLFDCARQLFDEMPELNCVRTVKSFNALLEACVCSRKFDKVDGFFKELPRELGVKPDVVSFNTVIKAFCEMGSLDLAVSVLDEMEKHGVRPDLISFNTLFDAFYKEGRVLEGDKMWDSMRKYDVVPDITSYNIKLLGLVLREEVRGAVDLIGEIKNAVLMPDKFTYHYLFKGLSSDRKFIEDVKYWYSCMMKEECEPDGVTFDILLPYAIDVGDFMFGSLMCRKLFYSWIRVKDASLVQKIVDGLVEQSRVAEAVYMVRLGRNCGHHLYRSLKRP